MPYKFSIKKYTPPAGYAVSLAKVKEYLRINHDVEDALIAELISAATQGIERFLGQSIITQSYKITYNDNLPREVRLPYGPVQQIASVKAVDKAGVETVISSDAYYLDEAGNIVFDACPVGHKIEVVYTTGYGDESQVPDDIITAMLSYITVMYEMRDDAVKIPPRALSALGAIREVRF